MKGRTCAVEILIVVAALLVPTVSQAQTANCTNWTFFTVNGSLTTDANGINSWNTTVGSAGGSKLLGFIRYSDGSSTTYGYPNAIATWFTRRNYFGVTLGYYMNSNETEHGLVISKSGSIAVVNYPSAARTLLTGINYWGSIVGNWNKGAGTLDHAFELKNGKFFTIQYPNSAQDDVTGISDNGVIVGYYSTSAGGGISPPNGFVYANGVYKTLNDPAGSGSGTYLLDINKSGTIVGIYYYGTDPHSFLYTSGTFKNIVAPNATATTTFIQGINNNNDVVGYVQTSSGQKSFEAHCQ